MGYTNTTMVIYGIKLSDSEAEKITETLEPLCEEGGGIYLSSSSSFEIALYSDGTDSRVHSLSYEDGYDHVFGINYCSNGYAENDDIVDGIRNVPQKVIDDYEKYAKTFLESLNITTKPDVLVIDQVH